MTSLVTDIVKVIIAGHVFFFFDAVKGARSRYFESFLRRHRRH